MRNRSVFQTALVVALAATTVILSGCGKDGDAVPPATASSAVSSEMQVGPENVAVATIGPLSSGPAVSGTLAPERSATVRAQIGGAVLQTYVEAGQGVRRGTLLARIDASGIQDAFVSARSGVTSAQNNLDVAERDLARSQKLLAAGAIAERDIDQARRAAITARAGLQDARARLAGAQRQVGNTAITSPINGVVSEKAISAGDVVQPGGALYTVVDPSSMRLEASVPAEHLSTVRTGIPVSFTVNGYPGRQFLGRVMRINPTADPITRQVRILVAVPNTEGALVGGLFAEGRIATDSRNGVVVPVAAVDVRGATPTVVKIRSGKVERVPVRIGIRDESSERLEITSGVTAGDTLLLGAAQGITPGTPTRISSVPAGGNRQ